MRPFKKSEPHVYLPPPRSPQARAALRALRSVPGPSPWYLAGLRVPSARGHLRWRSAGEHAPLAGRCFLQSEAGVVVAIADFQCYVRPIADNRLLSWYRSDSAGGRLRLQLHDIEKLAPIDDVAGEVARLSAAERLRTASEPLSIFEFSTGLADGSHQVEVPVHFQGLTELLLLAPSTAEGRKEDGFREMHQCLWILDPRNGALEAIPQDWFNEGPYDFGYQWITRVARLPDTGRIVGEGIRLGVFQLEAANRRVDEWLVTDIFYRPEPDPFEAIAPEA